MTLYFPQRKEVSNATLLQVCCAFVATRSAFQPLPSVVETVLRDVYDPDSLVEGSRELKLRVADSREWEADLKETLRHPNAAPQRWAICGCRCSGKSVFAEYLVRRTAEQRGRPYRRIGRDQIAETDSIDFYDKSANCDAWIVDYRVTDRRFDSGPPSRQLNAFRQRVHSIRADVFVMFLGIDAFTQRSFRENELIEWAATNFNPVRFFSEQWRKTFLPWISEPLFSSLCDEVCRDHHFLVVHRPTRKIYCVRADLCRNT